jgi:hypothetical protein
MGPSPSFQELGAASSQTKHHLHHIVPPEQYTFQAHGQHQLPLFYNTLSPPSSTSIPLRQGPQQYLSQKTAPRTARDEGQAQQPLLSLEGGLSSPTTKTESYTVGDHYRVRKAIAGPSGAMSGKKRSASTEESVMTKGKKQSGAGCSKSPGKYSEQVKKSLAASSRTNQACDRCKVRL